MAGRKRVYSMPVSTSSRPYKKRKIFKRKRKSKKTYSYTSKSVRGNGFGYKNIRTSRKTYKNRLWIATSAKTKYRSVMSRASTSTAPLGSVDQNNTILNALKNLAGDFFWVTAGGRQSIENNIAVSFSGASIVIRGGIIKLTCTNENNVADCVQVKVWLMKANKTTINGAGWVGNKTAGFDPTMVLDNRTVLGSLVMYREFLLENNTIGEVSYRLPLMEIDLDAFNGGNQGYFWLTSVYAPAGNACNVIFVNSYNLSFVGDEL